MPAQHGQTYDPQEEPASVGRPWPAVPGRPREVVLDIVKIYPSITAAKTVTLLLQLIARSPA
jgi:hypothetical protein